MVGHCAAHGGRQVGRHAQPGIEPVLLRQPAQQRQPGQAGREQAGDALDDVPVLEVAQFVRQHGLDLGWGELLQQGVEEHHALGGAKAGEVGIGVRAAAAAVHHEQALGGKAAAGHELRHAFGQRFILQRLKLVEQGRDDRGVDHQHQQAEAHPQRPRPQPPQAAGGLHQPQHQRRQRHADDKADQRGLEQIAQPQPQRHLVEAEALFDHEGLVQRHRQLDQGVDGGEHHQQRQRLQQRARAQRVQQQAVKPVQPAQQRPGQQHGGGQCQLQQAEAQLGDGVVGRALVGIERDGGGKLGWHGAAVARHGADLARGQPELHGHVGQQRQAEQQGEYEGGGQRWVQDGGLGQGQGQGGCNPRSLGRVAPLQGRRRQEAGARRGQSAP